MFKRIARVFRSLFGWLIGKAENPELILRQHIEDLRARIPEFNKNAAEVVKLEKMLPLYYKLRGWDKSGVPTPKTLKKLDLDFVDLNALR